MKTYAHTFSCFSYYGASCYIKGFNGLTNDKNMRNFPVLHIQLYM